MILKKIAQAFLIRSCTAVEKVNAYLKEYFQLNNVLYLTGKRAKAHFNLVTLVYNAPKLACDHINRMLSHPAA